MQKHTDRQGFIVDLDGTLYRGQTQLPGAAAFVEAIRASSSSLLFMTNNSTRVASEVALHLNEMGIPASVEDVLTTSQSAVRYLNEDGRGKRVYAIGEQGLTGPLLEAGYELVNGASGADYVVQGLDRSFNYEKLTIALELILEGAVFVQTNPDVRLPMDNGFLPGAGAIGVAISTATDIKPVVIGKPSTIMMGHALEQLGLPASSVWMVGDNMRTDMAAGKAAGCKTALLFTGVTTKQNLSMFEEELGFTCDYIGEQLPDFAAYLD
jgi:4-nitrophenyl phosphatase